MSFSSKLLALAEAYLAVEQARFADRMAYRVDVDAALLDARVPSLILQPLVENAIRHGLAARAGVGRVEIAVAVPDDAVVWFAFNYVRGHDAETDLMSRCLSTVAQHCGDGMTWFVAKPWTAEELLAAVARALDRPDR